MKIAEINMVAIGSTGKIMLQIAERAREKGHIVKTFSTNVFSTKYKKLPPPPNGDHEYFGSYFENGIHTFLGKITGHNGSFSRFSTFRLIRKLKKFNPDVIHLHNLHAFCINLPMLFGYIKKNNIKTVWTLHDCWSFTGHCPHFDMIGCDKWKSGCYNCPQFNSDYLHTYRDVSKKMYKLKKKWFTGVKDMTLVTPSNWLAGLVKESFLKEYSVKVIHNGIDLSIFKPTESNFREKYNCKEKFIVLGVSFGWGVKKGLDVFIELSKRLDERFQIVLVGTSDDIDAQLPSNIISIHQTQNQQELAEIYTAADLFVNPTREDTFPTVNIESLACGTPLVTFNTGGSPEVCDETCGIVVPKDDTDALFDAIYNIHDNKPFSKEACIERAKAFDKNDKFLEYVKLYEDGI